MGNVSKIIGHLELGMYIIQIPGLRFESDDELRDAYHQHMGSGAFLYKYAGLWMLALDVLPTEAEDQLELYTYRGCRCPLEAYVWESL